MERKLPTMPKREMHGMRKPSTRNLKNDSSSYSTTSPYSAAVEFSPSPVPLSANIFPPPPPPEGVRSRREPLHADPACGIPKQLLLSYALPSAVAILGWPKAARCKHRLHTKDKKEVSHCGLREGARRERGRTLSNSLPFGTFYKRVG